MSILDQHSADRTDRHDCGGAILMGPDTPDGRMYYCDKCGAFRYGQDNLPSGTDPMANNEAYNLGDIDSPDFN